MGSDILDDLPGAQIYTGAHLIRTAPYSNNSGDDDDDRGDGDGEGEGAHGGDAHCSHVY